MNIAVEAVNGFLHMYLTYLFFKCVFDIRCKKQTIVPIFITSGLLLTVAMLTVKGNPIMYFILFVLSMLLSILFTGKFIHKAIYSVIFFAFASASEMFVAVVINSIFNVDFVEGKQGSVYISGMLISKFILFLVVLFFRIKKQASFLENLKGSYFSIYAFPTATFLLMIAQHNIFVKNPEQDMASMLFMLVCYTLLTLSNIIVFDFIDTLYSNTVNENKIATANEIIANQTNQYKALIEHNSKIAQIQHDNKHFFVGLIAELNNGNIEIAKYKLTEACKITQSNINESNGIIHTIVDLKYKEAEEKGVNIIFEYRNIDSISIPAMDIAILLGNAIDNAIEACEKISDDREKNIQIYIALKNEALYISIKNPVIENVDINNTKSSKSNVELHGYGIISMQQIAKKYDGEVVFKCENKLFTTTIFLKNSIV